MKGKSYRIVVKDISKLEDYGFVKKKKKERLINSKRNYGYFFYSGRTDKYGKTTYCISVYVDDNRVNMMTCGGAALKVLCELYKDGIIEFTDIGCVQERISKKLKQIEKLEKEIKALKGE